MNIRLLPLLLSALGTALLAVATVAGEAAVSKLDAANLKQKVASIVEFAGTPVTQSRRTTVTENEVNAYLVFEAKEDIPTGVVGPTVTILGTGRVAARAVVDLDAVRKAQNPTSVFDPVGYLTGHVPVTAVGVLTASGGVGRIQLESSSVGGVPVPKFLLQQIVGYYSRTLDRPSGINIDDPFALPVRIREIQVERGQAIIIQ